MPSRVLDDGELCLAWEWKGRQTPVRCVDARSGLGYDWGYEGGGEPLPTHVGIQGEAVRRLGIAGGSWGTDKDYFLLGLDQVGSFRALINGAGGIAKRGWTMTASAMCSSDSLPEVYIPLGFSGGIVWTGLRAWCSSVAGTMIRRWAASSVLTRPKTGAATATSTTIAWTIPWAGWIGTAVFSSCPCWRASAAALSWACSVPGSPPGRRTT